MNMAQGPSHPDDQWERSMRKGLDAFFAHEHERETSPASPAPRPDPKEGTADTQPQNLKAVFAPETPIGEPSAPPANQPDPELEAMLSAFAKHADPPSDPEPSISQRAELPEDRPRPVTGPLLVREFEPRQRPLRSTIADGASGASRLASVVGSRTKDYLRSAHSNFTRPVFKQPARKKKKRKKSTGIDGREAAVIVLSIVGLAEVGWIGWRVTNPPPPAVVVNRGVRSSEAVKVETETVAPKSSPATQPKNVAPARSKAAAPAPTPAAKVPASPAAAKDSPSEPATTATSGSTSGWVTITSSTPVEVFEQGKRLSVRGGRVSLPAGRHDLEFRNRALGTSARRTVDVASDTETAIALDKPGSVNVNALPWASVIIDGAPVGDTPLANLPLSAGPHDVVFKHPELGERRLKVTVAPGAPLRVSTDLRSRGK
jgi:hypothetical protein